MLRRIFRNLCRFSQNYGSSTQPANIKASGNQPVNVSEAEIVQKPTNINQPSNILNVSRKELSNNGWRIPDVTHKRSQKTHLSNGQQLIHRVPIIYVQTNIVRCIGGTELNAGHSQEYIQLNTRNPDKPSSCKYCGLRYQMVHHSPGFDSQHDSMHGDPTVDHK